METRSKKLYKHMTNDEKLFLKKKIERANAKYFSNHALSRMEEKNISKKDIFEIFNKYEIIEFNYRNGTNPRVLLRGTKEDKDGYCTCISLDFIDNRVITAYKNHSSDNHSTLDIDRYSNNIHIKDIMV